MHITQFKQLSSGRKFLIRTMQQINFGRIERLKIKDGEPVFDPAPRLIKEIKFGSDNNSPRAEVESPDFPLKTQILDLFFQIDGISSGQIDLIEIKHGLPFRMLVEG